MTHKYKTWFLIFVLNFLFLVFGMQVAGRQGLLAAFAIALVANAISFFYSQKILLWTYRAKQIEGADPYGINKALTSLAKKAGINCSIESYIAPSSTPNAFSLGTSVVVTEGFLKVLSKEEQLVILAHEIAHIKNNDSIIQSSAAVMGSLIMYISQFIQWAIFLGNAPDKNKPTHLIARFFYHLFAPFSAFLVRIAIRKKREFEADETALKLCEFENKREVLANALWKIHNYSLSLPMKATMPTAHLFVVSPLENKGIEKLFITHPKTEDRIKNLIGRYPL